jgi:taurine dioxygenase
MPTPSTTSLDIRPFAGRIGAEARGVDLAGEVDDATQAALHRALVDHVALVVRDQSLDPPRFLAAGSRFGKPFSAPYPHTVEGLPLVQVVSSHDRNEDGSVRLFGRGWHTDHADELRPPKFTALHAVELFRRGGSTGIVNMRAAWDALPAGTRAKLDGLQVIYARRRARRLEGATTGIERGAPEVRSVAHPLVRTDPDTGRKNLYLHPGIAQGIVGMPPQEAEPLLRDLLAHALDPAWTYDHHWTLGDLLIWDNRSTMHRANYDYDPADTSQRRLLYRMMVEGEHPR